MNNKSNTIQKLVDELNQIAKTINHYSLEISDAISSVRELRENETLTETLQGQVKFNKSKFAEYSQYILEKQMQLEETSLFDFKKASRLRTDINRLKEESKYLLVRNQEIARQILQLNGKIHSLYCHIEAQNVEHRKRLIHQAISTYNMKLDELSLLTGKAYSKINLPMISDHEIVSGIFIHPLSFKENELVVEESAEQFE